MAADFCSYLGSLDGEGTHTHYPSRWNLCYALEEPQPISLLDQRELCLGANYFECPLLSPDFVEAEADVSLSRGVNRGARRVSPSPQDEKPGRGNSLFIVAVVCLVLVLLCGCLCLGGLVVLYFFSGG